MNTRIYNLLVKEQSTLLELLREMEVEDAQAKIVKILDKDEYEVLECSDTEILKIKKKSSGEVFEKGGKFYHVTYKKWVEDIRFDEALTGAYLLKDHYYKNYVRANSGLYKLSEMSTVEIDVPKELTINGFTYALK